MNKSLDISSLGFLQTAPAFDRYSASLPDPVESTGFLVSQVPQEARILDVGCGTGSISALFRDLRKAEVHGVEPDEARAAVARNRGITVNCCFLDDLSPSDLGQFDAIVMADVIEHVADPLTLLQRTKSFLKPNGMILTSVPNMAHWTVRANLFRGRFEYRESGIMDATHLRWFTKQTLEELLDRAGFRVEEYAGSAGLWMPVYNHRRLFRMLGPNNTRRIITRLVKRRPTLFACQHLVKAVRKAK